MSFSRGKIEERRSKPLTLDQQQEILHLVGEGVTDSNIAYLLDVTVAQVEYLRLKAGIVVERNCGGRPPGWELRPKHVRGYWPDGEWFDSQNVAFAKAMDAELKRRKSENPQIDIEEAIANAAGSPQICDSTAKRPGAAMSGPKTDKSVCTASNGRFPKAVVSVK